MAKVDLNKLDDYYDEEPVHVEKIKRKKPVSEKKSIKKDNKHKVNTKLTNEYVE